MKNGRMSQFHATPLVPNFTSKKNVLFPSKKSLYIIVLSFVHFMLTGVVLAGCAKWPSWARANFPNRGSFRNNFSIWVCF